MSLKEKINVAISSDFLKSFSNIPKDQQSKVREFVEKFRTNPASKSINYEKIANAKDKNIHSVRIDKSYRGIVLKPDQGNVYMLLWVDNHDKAYQWAMNKTFEINPEIGSLQIVDISEEDIHDIKKQKKPDFKGLFDDFKDKDLIRLGVPETLLPLVRKIVTEDQLDESVNKFPQEVFEALYMMAAGYTIEEVYNELVTVKAVGSIDTNDFAASLDNINSKRRFYVVENELELIEILNSPLEQWRIFLHPSQRRVVEMDANGPVKVLGGAGTGKTVVAMHRAKWLAQNIFNDKNDKLLFTTFTKNLAVDLEENLKKLCSKDLLKRIEVINLDAWVVRLLKKNGYDFRLIFDANNEFWKNALNLAPKELDFNELFYRDEWEFIIQQQSVLTLKDYIKASRIGRKIRLSRFQRQTIWPVFEEYRRLLTENGFKEIVDAIRDARNLLENQKMLPPYKVVIVDEAQDMSNEAFKLISRLVPSDGKNNLFIVGDAHQRIYKNKVILSHCGINVIGRSRKLKINYRTTEETRKWALNILKDITFDDLDNNEDDRKGYKSLLHGNFPTVKNFSSFKEETEYIRKYIDDLRKEDIEFSSICLVARTNNFLMQYDGALKAAGLPIYCIRRSVAEDREKDAVRLATMHRVKGLEFDYVIIAGANNGIIPYTNYNDYDVIGEEELNETRERSLLYVAATRAKKEVLITSYGEKSCLI